MSHDHNIPNGFSVRDGYLFCEAMSAENLAERFATPLYIYSQAAITDAFTEWTAAFDGTDHLICFAVKANSNIAVLKLLASLGSGFDIVSGGELQRVLAAGGDPGKVVFSGVGKSAEEIELAITSGIRCFNVESAPELALIEKTATRLNKVAPISIRLNPDVDAKTHPYISTGLKENKFGVNSEMAKTLYHIALESDALLPVGIDCHIGSQLTEIEPFRDSVKHLKDLVLDLRSSGIELQHVDIGGGLGIQYRDENIPSAQALITAVREQLDDLSLELMIEPGRSIVGNAGALLTRVMVVKEGETKHFAVVDAAMNDLLRPALYSAWQTIVEASPGAGQPQVYDVVGPVCETGDFLGKDRELSIVEGDLLAVLGAGAYSFTMSSNYNSRPRAAEVLVNDTEAHVIRKRERVEDLWADECLPEHIGGCLNAD
ncbi:MAG: diaminopimelate decarboxylase [Gammaproteobacteria bacterium]|nr:diaminopimelate decarboxylase [Gammaproteobacteria bacterium]